MDKNKTPENAEVKTKAAKAAEIDKESAAIIDATEAFERKYRPLIAAKVKAGLSDKQARAVILTQLREDPQILTEQLEAIAAKG